MNVQILPVKIISGKEHNKTEDFFCFLATLRFVAREVFCEAKMGKINLFLSQLRPAPRWGAYDASTHTLYTRGTPSPLFTPLDAYGVSTFAPPSPSISDGSTSVVPGSVGWPIIARVRLSVMHGDATKHRPTIRTGNIRSRTQKRARQRSSASPHVRNFISEPELTRPCRPSVIVRRARPVRMLQTAWSWRPPQMNLSSRAVAATEARCFETR